MRTEVNNRPQTNGTKNDKKNNREVMPAIRIGKISELRPTAKAGRPSARNNSTTLGRGLVPVDEPHTAAPSAAVYAQHPHVQQNPGLDPQGNRSIRSRMEGSPDRQE